MAGGGFAVDEKREKAIEWLGDRWLLAVPVPRITPRRTPQYIERPLPSLLRPQASDRRDAA
jgi:hypothetical protein